MGRSLQSREISRKRPWLAVLLTALLPGLGHAYLRLWGRALMWIGLTILGVVFLFPVEMYREIPSLAALVEMTTSMSAGATMALFSIIGFCGLDAYLMAQRINHFVGEVGTERPPRCPECGNELDGDLDFCHWCTTELDDVEV